MFGSTAAQKKALQRVNTAEKKKSLAVIFPLEELHSSQCPNRAQNITRDSHPGHNRFELLPSGRQYRGIKVRTNRLKNRFYPIVVKTLNTAKKRVYSFAPSSVAV